MHDFSKNLSTDRGRRDVHTIIRFFPAHTPYRATSVPLRTTQVIAGWVIPKVRAVMVGRGTVPAPP